MGAAKEPPVLGAAVRLPTVGTIEALAYSIVGTIGGAAIALALLQPDTPAGFAKRSLVSVASGMMLTPAVLSYFELAATRDNLIAGSCVVSAVAWWCWHGVIRAVQAWSPTFPKRRE